jgi:hypothetical protein
MVDACEIYRAKGTGTLQAATGAPSVDSGLRVVHAVEVGNQARARWLPVQLPLRNSARGREVLPHEVGEPAEMRPTSPGVMLTTGTFSPQTRALAIAFMGTPSSSTAW